MMSCLWAESYDTESPVMDDSREKNSETKEKEMNGVNTMEGAPFLFFIS